MKNKTSLYGNKRARTSSIVVISILLVLAIVLNVALDIVNKKYGLIINRFLTGDNVDTSAGGEVFSEADKVVRTASEDSMVLLENKNNFLPLKDLKKVNLFGWGSTEYGFLLTGGGSGGAVIANDKDVKVDLNDAFTAENIEYNQELYDAYCNFSNFDADFREGGSTGKNAVDSLLNPDQGFYTNELMTAAKEYSQVAVAVLSRWGVENGGDHELKAIGNYREGAYLELTENEKAMFEALKAHSFDVIVVLNTCNNIELGFVKDYDCIKACIFAGIPGQSGAIAIPEIITGKINPSGKTSDTLCYDNNTYNPTYANATKVSGNLVYQEGIYFGYKWYETADAEGVFKDLTNNYGTGYNAVVQYPFGYGLSYTNFIWTTEFPTISGINATGNYEVKVTVENTGLVAGKDVVQLYGHVDYIEGGIERAEKVLIDFAKTKLLEPGEEETVTLKFNAYDLASYDDYDKNGNGFKGFELEGGSNNVEMSIQSDSHTVKESKKYSVTGNIQYKNDPQTGKPVENLFTGSTAYANCPIDGSSVYKTDKINYLSRKEGFKNYSEIKQYGKPSDEGAVDRAASYRYDGYDDKDVSDINYGMDAAIYLVVAAESAESTNTHKANLSQLNGEATDVVLKINESMREDIFNILLADFDSDYWDFFLDQLTQDEIKKLIGSGGFMTVAVESIGKTRCTDKDGPAGYNNNVTNPNVSSIYTLYPSESLLGCSWSREVGYSIGEAQGKIGTALGINGWYGPGVNLHRSVYNSRNYEYYSEDGILSGKIAAATVQGAKDNNVYCYVKHMAVSEAGQNPKNLNTWLTEQALREQYLKPFEITVKEGKTVGMMSAFNRVGAVLSGYNHALLTDVLREEWGFNGTVITDWYMSSDSYMSDYTRGVLAGNDLWLSGSGDLSANLDLSDPAVAYAARQSAKSIIYTYMTTLLSTGNLKVNAEKQSPLYTTAWIVLDLIIAAFIVLNAIKLIRTFIPPKAADTVVTNGNVTFEISNTDDTGDDEEIDETTSCDTEIDDVDSDESSDDCSDDSDQTSDQEE